jgi:CheY-like chemotaxis protein
VPCLTLVAKALEGFPSMSSKRILVVDDDAIVGVAIRITLQPDNHTIEVVTSPEEALRRFEVGKYDLIITDFRMEGMTGLQLAEQIKARDLAQTIILLSGSPPFPETSVFDLVILKPFDNDLLRNAVAQFVK